MKDISYVIYKSFGIWFYGKIYKLKLPILTKGGDGMEGFSNWIRWFIIILLIISVFLEGYFNYGITLALIYLLLRAPLTYTKPNKK